MHVLGQMNLRDSSEIAARKWSKMFASAARALWEPSARPPRKPTKPAEPQQPKFYSLRQGFDAVRQTLIFLCRPQGRHTSLVHRTPAKIMRDYPGTARHYEVSPSGASGRASVVLRLSTGLLRL